MKVFLAYLSHREGTTRARDLTRNRQVEESHPSLRSSHDYTRLTESPDQITSSTLANDAWACLNSNRTATHTARNATSSVDMQLSLLPHPRTAQLYRIESMHQAGHPVLTETKQEHPVYQIHALINHVSRNLFMSTLTASKKGFNQLNERGSIRIT
jgi:hypothetical protein